MAIVLWNHYLIDFIYMQKYHSKGWKVKASSFYTFIPPQNTVSFYHSTPLCFLIKLRVHLFLNLGLIPKLSFFIKSPNHVFFHIKCNLHLHFWIYMAYITVPAWDLCSKCIVISFGCMRFSKLQTDRLWLVPSLLMLAWMHSQLTLSKLNLNVVSGISSSSLVYWIFIGL